MWEVLRGEVRRAGMETVRISRQGEIVWSEKVSVHPRLVAALLDYLQIRDDSPEVQVRIL